VLHSANLEPKVLIGNELQMNKAHSIVVPTLNVSIILCSSVKIA